MKWCVCELCLESGSWSWCPCASLDLNLNVREDLSYCFLCFIGCSLNFLDLCDFEQMGGEQVWGKMPVCLKFSWLISAFSRICQTEQVLALPAITVNKTPSCSLRSAHHSLNVSNICCPLHEAPTLQRPALWQPNYSRLFHAWRLLHPKYLESNCGKRLSAAAALMDCVTVYWTRRPPVVKVDNKMNGNQYPWQAGCTYEEVSGV